MSDGPIDYDNIDLAYTNYGLSDKAFERIQKMNEDHLKEHPTCEICRHRPSVRITPIGTLRAACLECIGDMRAQIQEDVERSLAEDEDYYY